MNTTGRVNHCGGAVAACPLVASDNPTPAIAADVSTQAIVLIGLRHAIPAVIIAALAISSDGPRLVASALVHGADVARLRSGRFSKSIPCRPSDATALTRPMASAPKITAEPLRPCPIQAAKNT